MQEEQLSLIDVAPIYVEVAVEVLPDPAPKATPIFLVAAYRAMEIGGYWKIHRETQNHEYTTRGAAVAAAGRLDPHWTHRTILSVNLA
jgi:hypothetical protein